VPTTAALVYLGNCGGYTLLEAILRKAPNAHILSTKGIGTLTINDPLLKALNDSLLSGKIMTWASFWRQAEAALGNNPGFVDYVPQTRMLAWFSSSPIAVLSSESRRFHGLHKR
jgi:hypothetical protein